MYVLSTETINKLKKYPLKKTSVNVSTIYRICYNFVTISLRGNENKLFKIEFINIIRIIILLYDYVEALVVRKIMYNSS